MHRAAALLEHAKQILEKAQPEFRHLTIAGGFRRGCELVAEPGFSMTCFESAGGPKVASAGSTRPVGIVSGWGSRYAELNTLRDDCNGRELAVVYLVGTLTAL
jgi:hypothetical protein